MTVFVTHFLGAFGGAFAGVVSARVVGAWVVRRAFERMRAAALVRTAAVPANDVAESDCA